MQLIKNFINGEFLESLEGRTFQKRSPINNQVIANVCEAGRHDECGAAGRRGSRSGVARHRRPSAGGQGAGADHRDALVAGHRLDRRQGHGRLHEHLAPL